MFTTDQYHGMLAETVTYAGANGDVIDAYLARPLGPGPFPSVVLIHNVLGWGEFYYEMTRKFAHHGYVAICPNLFDRDGDGAPEDVAAQVRADGGPPDDRVVADVEGAATFVRSLPYTSGKVGVIGSCSGGRHTFLAACRTSSFDAAVDLWGGRVVMPPEDLTERTPVSPIEYTKDLSCPLLGLFGVEDRNPTPEIVSQLEAALQEHGKQYEFHSYEGAGHGFFYYHMGMYRQEQAVDGWDKVFTFFEKHLA
ncbi:MAG: dienelactone hydrolase family protein [Dehalococcoidia bacterium]